MENKTIVSPQFTGALTMESFTSSGSATIGDDAADSLTVNAAATFAASTTFSNTVIQNSGLTLTGDLQFGTSGSVRLPETSDVYFSHANNDGNTGNTSFGFTAISGLGGIYNDTFYIIDQSSRFSIGSSGTIQLGSESSIGVWLQADNASTRIYHSGNQSTLAADLRIDTTATGITINGAIDAVTNITSTGNIVSSGSAHQLDGQLGIGRAAATYTLEVEGSIFATGSSLIIGDAGTSKSIIQKRVACSALHFTDDTGADQAILDGGGQFGIGKTPGYKLDVSGDGWFDGDITINTTNPVAKTGGKVTAREILLIDPQTGASTTLDATSAGGVSRAKVYFHSFN